MTIFSPLSISWCPTYTQVFAGILFMGAPDKNMIVHIAAALAATANGIVISLNINAALE
tara:strand:+ start:122 stop:298 length:177 start_codon:yes stop_codon:yes gene_type:complete